MAITATVTRGFTFATGVETSASSLNLLGEPTVTVDAISATSVTLENKTVSTLPTNGTAGRIVYVSDGDGGNPCLAVDNGTNWLRVNLGSAVSATDADEYLMTE
tara:strand:- start:67 stop:378 length:312 start_codon:yes stop_codon:yes gene_type:complete